MRSLITNLKPLGRWFKWQVYKYFPRFMRVLYLYTPPTRFEPEHWQYLPPGSNVTLTRRQKLVEFEVLNLFGFHTFATIKSSYRR